MSDDDEAQMVFYARVLFLPLTLLLNFSLFQYLTGVYWARRREPLVGLLLGAAFVGVAAMVPFSDPDVTVWDALNTTSENASVLTFLVQIVIFGRDVGRQLKLRAVVWITHAAEALVVLELVLTLGALAQLFLRNKRTFSRDVHELNEAAQDLALWFIFLSRFYFLAMARGLRHVLATRRLELAFYVLFVTHPYPFEILEEATGISWSTVEAVWHRFTLSLCVLVTIRDKVLTSRKTSGAKRTRTRGAATQSKLDRSELQPPSRAPSHAANIAEPPPTTVTPSSPVPTATNRRPISGPSLRAILPIAPS